MIRLADVQAAARVVQPQVIHTPMKRSTTLSNDLGCDFHLKLENFQRTGSFKVRGALWKIHNLGQEAKNGVVAASAGNHAQGVAYAATAAGLRSTLFMPEDATLAKVEATKGYGASVQLVGRDYQEAFEHATAFQKKTGAAFVHAFDDPFIMAGQGTLGLEVAQDLPNLDTVIVPIGGGGLISGVATAIKGLHPDVRVIGVQAQGASTVAPSLAKGRVVPLDSVDTMADGIACRTLGSLTFDVIKERVDEVVTVNESEIASSVLWLLERAKVVVEGAGAVSLAAAVTGKIELTGTTCAVMSGGNIDMTLVNRIIRRGMVKEGRVAIIETTVSDRPGQAAKLLQMLAQLKANVIDIRHDRYRLDIGLNRTGIEVHVETRGASHIEEIQRALASAGYEARISKL